MSGLGALPDFVGTSDDELARVQEAYATFDQVELELQQLGFPPMEKPQYQCPEITPETLTSISSDDYASLYTKYNAWYNYAHNTFARIKAQRLGYQEEMDEIARVIKRDIVRRTKDSPKKPSKEAQEATVEENPRHTELRLETLKLNQLVMLAESHVEGLERSLRLISRQIELIRMDHENARINGNVPARGRSPMGQIR